MAIDRGKTEEQIKHHIAHNLRKRCIKKGFEGIHNHFQNDPTFRESLLSIDRTEARWTRTRRKISLIE